MKLVTFTHNNVTHVGKLVSRNGQEQVVDLTASGLPLSLIHI